MNKAVWALFLVLFSANVLADNNQDKLQLDMVGYQVTARQWVNTTSALVDVTVNASLNNSDLVKARSEIMSQLNTIAKGQWHITSFNRSQDSSGLEKLTVQAQARVDQALLPNIYKQANSVSKPGLSYAVSSIQFTPSLEEFEKAKAELRKTLYDQASQELSRLNKVYTGQQYNVYRLNFTEGDAKPQPHLLKAREMMNTMVMPAAAPSMSVSNELMITANVVVASNRKQG
jgi:hypothetical protein